MNPILYEKNETEFASNGLGRLQPTSCVVSETLNGEYELTMEISIEDKHFSDLQNDRIICAKPANEREPQPFRIYRIEKNIRGRATVYAEHISYQLNNIPVMPFTANNLPDALQGLKTNSAENNPFTFYTDRVTAVKYTLKKPNSVRALLGGTSGSILDVYGHGEYYFDKWRVEFLAHRGQDRNVVLRYSKNLTDLQQEENIESMFTGICPYWASTETDDVVTLPEKVIEAESASAFSFHRTRVVDLSSSFQEKPTEEQLRTKAQTYIINNGIGVPEVSIKLDFIALWQTEDYKDIAPLERVFLGDTIKVYFEKLGVTASAQIVKAEYDCLAERYTKLEIGNTKATLTDQFQATDEAIQQAQEETSNAMGQMEVAIRQRIEDAVTEATDRITGNSGGYFVINDANGDGVNDEILMMDTPDISTARKVWRWNLAGLGYSASGYNGTFGLAITQDGKIVANYIATGTLDASLLNVINLNAGAITTGTLDGSKATITNLNASNITGGTLQDSSRNFVLDLSTGKLTAKNLVVVTDNFKIYENGNVAIKGRVEATEGSFSGSLNAATGTFSGTLNGVDGTFTGTLNGNTITGATITGSNITASDTGQTGNRPNIIAVNGNTQSQMFSDAFYILNSSTSPPAFAEMTTGGFRASNGSSMVALTPNLFQVGSLSYNTQTGQITLSTGDMYIDNKKVLVEGDLDSSFSSVNATLSNHATQIYNNTIDIIGLKARVSALEGN